MHKAAGKAKSNELHNSAEIPQRESLTIEFKSDRKRLSDSTLVEAVVGLANTAGGTLYLGIEDDGRVTGLHEDHLPIQPVVFIANHTIPSVSIRAELMRIDGHDILRIEVPKSHGIVATRSGKLLRRRLKADNSPENVPLYPFEIPIRLSELGAFDFSAQVLPDATLEDFDTAEIDRLRTIIGRQHGDAELLALENKDLFATLLLTEEQDGRPVPTVAGLLLLAKKKSLARFLPTAKASFQILEGTAVRLNEEMQLPLLATLETFTSYLKPWNTEEEVSDGLVRTAIPDFSPDAFREALVNAFCHRDYAMLGMTRVQLTEEGLTIENPGGFIEGISLENLISAPPRGRNPALADAMKRIGLTERTGRGIDRIYAGSIRYGRPLPDYSESTSTSVQVFIPRAKADVAFMRLIHEEEAHARRPLSIHALLVLSVLQVHPRQDFSEIQAATGFSRQRLQTILSQLTESSLVDTKQIESSTIYLLNGSQYRADKGTSPSPATPPTPADKQDDILGYVRAHGSITRQEAATLLGTSPATAYKILRKLVGNGHLIATGKNRGRKYIAPV